MPKESCRVTFDNVQITLEGTDPADCYAKLCALLERGIKPHELDYTTDTFEVVEPPKNPPWPTSGDTVLLWPDQPIDPDDVAPHPNPKHP